MNKRQDGPEQARQHQLRYLELLAIACTSENPSASIGSQAVGANWQVTLQTCVQNCETVHAQAKLVNKLVQKSDREQLTSVVTALKI